MAESKCSSDSKEEDSSSLSGELLRGWKQSPRSFVPREEVNQEQKESLLSGTQAEIPDPSKSKSVPDKPKRIRRWGIGRIRKDSSSDDSCQGLMEEKSAEISDESISNDVDDEQEGAHARR